MPRTSADRLAQLYAATTALTRASLDAEQLMVRIVEEAAALTGARYAGLGVLGPEGRLIHFVHHGLTPEEYERLKDNPPHGDGILGALLVEGWPLRLDDLTADPRSAGFPPGHPPMRTFLGVPLHLGGDVIGRLYMTESERGAFDEEDEQLALGFAAAASVAIGNARLNADARVAAGQLRAVVDAFGRGVSMTDGSGRIVLVNERLIDLLGVPMSPVGLPERDLAERFAVPEAFLSALGLEQAQADLSFQAELALREAPDRVLSRYGGPVLAPDGTRIGRIAVYSDVTQEREVQAQLVDAERLRATGEMASGLAHDFNNLLATILGRAEIVLGQGRDAALREHVLAIQRAARDGTATVARLREYGRPLDAGAFAPVSLEEVVRQAVDLTQPRWRDQAQHEGRTIAVELRLRPTPPVSGDATTLREVLVNLIFNAVDAMPRGGRLTIALGPSGSGVELTVQDTGQGMPEPVRRRIFEAFFTTKGDRGSGLGVPMARKAVLAHGGRIDVESTPGRGTTFAIWLPTTDAPLGQQTEPRPDAAVGRVGRVVVVDDQQDVLDTTAALLRGDGHGVRVFLDPDAAVAAIAADPPDLVISDLGMPGMNGWELARAVHARQPELPVALLTGWGREISAKQMRDGGIAAVLAKPIEGPALRQAVAAALTAEAEPLRVLIVDDSGSFAPVLSMLITQAGHRVASVDAASAALDALARDEYDLVMLDANLPDRPAADVVPAARAAARHPLVCVVSGSAVEAMAGTVPGADLYVEKVRLPERLEEIVHRARSRS